MVFVLREASSGQHGEALTEVAHKVVTEVEGHSALVAVQPPAQGQEHISLDHLVHVSLLYYGKNIS